MSTSHAVDRYFCECILELKKQVANGMAGDDTHRHRLLEQPNLALGNGGKLQIDPTHAEKDQSTLNRLGAE